MTNKDILKSLPLLASVLGRQYGVQVTVGGSTAYTTGRTVNIPALPLDADNEVLGMVRGYIDHEAGGHLRFTDFKAVRGQALSPAEQFILNAIEDWRVEKALSQVYPGCKANLEWLARKLFVDEFVPVHALKKAIMNYVLLTCRAWSVPEIEASRQTERQIIAKKYPKLLNKLDTMLAGVCANCPDTKAAVAHARQIASLIETHQEQEQSQGRGNDGERGEEEQAQGHGGEQGEEKHEQSQSQGHDEGQEEQEQSQSQGHGEGQEEHDAGQQAQCQEQEEEQDSESQTHKQSRPLHITEENLPKTFSEQLADKLGTASAQTPEREQVHVSVPVRRKLSPLSEDEQQMALAATTGMRYRLQSMLQAMRLRDVASSRHGKLCAHNLNRIFINNPKVFRRNDATPAVNTAVHILVDCSGSMDGEPIEQARQACFAIAHALKNMPGISLGVTAFPAESMRYGVMPVLEHGQAFHTNFQFISNGTTPLTEALLWTTQELCRQPESRKILIVLTDGGPDNPITCKQAIKEASRYIELYGIGIKDRSIKMLLPDTSEAIYELSELSPALFKLLQNSIISRRQI